MENNIKYNVGIFIKNINKTTWNMRNMKGF